MSDTSPGPSRRAFVVAILVAALLTGAVGFAVGRFTMFDTGLTPPATTSADAGFARDMQVHHAQAVDMSMTIQAKTDDEELRLLAYDIATTQAFQQGQMYDWLEGWGLPQYGEGTMRWMSGAVGHDHGAAADALTPEEAQEAMGMASTAQLDALDAATGTAADCLYLGLMARHHEGAIVMVDAALERAERAEVLALAAKMKDAQTFELEVIAAMRARIACT